MRDEAVKAKTGKDWAGWFRVLDRAGAAKLEHAAIAALLSNEHRVPGWWCQMVTVEYERARGKRTRHQTATGFQVGVTKTIATTLPALYQAAATAAGRRKWFPAGAFTPSSQTTNKYLRGAWNETARLEFGFYAKGAGKAQIALGVSKLANKAGVEVQRAAWKAACARLAALLEK